MPILLINARYTNFRRNILIYMVGLDLLKYPALYVILPIIMITACTFSPWIKLFVLLLFSIHKQTDINSQIVTLFLDLPNLDSGRALLVPFSSIILIYKFSRISLFCLYLNLIEWLYILRCHKEDTMKMSWENSLSSRDQSIDYWTDKTL